MSDKQPRYFPSKDKQTRNRYSSAGITQREADTINRVRKKLQTIQNKPGLFIGFRDRLEAAINELSNLLMQADREIDDS